MRVLVTRAFEHATRTAQELMTRGHEALFTPLSEVRFLDSEEMDLTDIRALLATSGIGVRAFARRCARRDLPLFTVGAASAATARHEGFIDVTSADGDAIALAEKIRQSLQPPGGALLHIAGKNSNQSFHALIAGAGFELRISELYEMVYRPELRENVIDSMRRGTVDAVLVMSPEGGRALVESLRRAGLATQCSRIVACCISAASAAEIQAIEFGAIRIAQLPDLDSVVALLDFGPGSAHA